MSYRGGNQRGGARGGSNFRGRGQPGPNMHGHDEQNAQMKMEECRFRFKCTHLFQKNGCRKTHSEDEIQGAQQLYAIKKFYSQTAIAYLTGEGQVKLHRFDKIPVHLAQQQDLNHDEFYRVKILEVNGEGTSFGIEMIECAGKIGDTVIEQEITEAYQEAYFKEWMGVFKAQELAIKAQLEEEKQKPVPLDLQDPSLKKGTFIIKFSGQEAVNCGTENANLMFEYKKNDQNRAIHGSEVLFKIKDNLPEVKGPAGPREKRYVEILDVKYPKNSTRIGYLKTNKLGQIFFCNLETKYGDMVVRDFSPEVFDKIKDENEYLGFSYVKKSKINKDYVEKHFFKAEFAGWSRHERNPYCKVTEYLGPIFDEKSYRTVLALNQGISQEMYPKNAITEVEQIEQDFDEKVNQDLETRKKYLEDSLVFTIDGPGTRAFDDAVSIKQVGPGKYRVGIHISDVAQIIQPGTSLDSEAFKRACSTYVLKDIHFPMLPQELNAGICSLSQGNKRYTVTLSIEINEHGIADFATMVYELSVIKSSVRLTYQEADELIRSQDASKSILTEKCTPEIESSLREKLIALNKLSAARRAFREQFDGVPNDRDDDEKEGKESKVIIEEMMLLSQSALPYFKDQVLNKAQQLHDMLATEETERISKKRLSKLDSLEKVDSELLVLSKKTSLQEVDVKEAEFIEIDGTSDSDDDSEANSEAIAAAQETQLRQRKAAIASRNFLIGFFKDMGVEFKSGSREQIEKSFDLGKAYKPGSQLFSNYMDSLYAKSYSHFAIMILVTKEEEALKPKDDVIMENESVHIQEEEKKGEKQTILAAKETKISEEVKQVEQLMNELTIKDTAQPRAQQVQIQKVQQDTSEEAKLNETLLKKLHEVSMEKRLKFTNPIRDYCHFLSNRMVHLLIQLNTQTEDAEQFFKLCKSGKQSSELGLSPSSELNTILEHILNLRELIDKIVKHVKKQLSYQHEVKFVMKNNSKMRAAERQINRLEYAFNILKEAGVVFAPNDQIQAEKKEEVKEVVQFHPLRDVDVGKVQGKSECILLTRISNKGRFEGWHPTLGEFEISDGAPKKDFKTRELEKAQKKDEVEGAQPKPEVALPERYSDIDVMLKIKTFVPLVFESVFKIAPKEEAKAVDSKIEEK